MATKLAVTGILETVLYAVDLEAIESFYADVLNMQPFAKSPGRQVFYRCGSQMLLYFNPDITKTHPASEALPIPPHGTYGEGHVCFRASAPEIEEWAALLTDKGIAIETDMQWPDGRGRSIYFRDPAGNCLEFAEPGIWGLE